MERVLDFSDVTSYDFSLMGSDMVLKLFQGDVVTKIRIGTDRPVTVALNSVTEKKPVEHAIPVAVGGSVQRKIPSAPAIKRKRLPIARLNETQVKEIRSNWDATVKACGTKNAAAEQLAKIYHCSAKNIYAIIYRYSWANI